MQKPSDLHSGNQEWNSVHTEGTGLEELLWEPRNGIQLNLAGPEEVTPT